MVNSLPPHLTHELKAAYESMVNHPQFDVTIGHRYAIYRAMGDTLPSIPKEDRTSHLRRTLLGLITVQHVLPIWEQALPTNLLPHRAIKEVITALENPLLLEGNFPSVNYWDECEALEYELSEKGIDTKFTGVGVSAFKCIQTLFDDIPYPVEIVDYTVTTFDNDFYEFDGAEWAVVSYGGGAWLRGDSRKRREFWEWWLTVAVPQSFRLEFDVLREEFWNE